MAAPYVSQDVQDVKRMIDGLEVGRKDKKKAGFSAKKNTFDVKNSQQGIQVDSWRMQEWDYKRPNLPTYARGLFTARNRRNEPEIAVRGYDKFFNVNEVNETSWENVIKNTKGPYELSLKENGCIIFVAGLEDDTLIVCSKHSTGDRSDLSVSHASAGEAALEKQLAAIGKSKTDLARELRKRNATAIAELCDDEFEEHILAYGPDKAGLYLHGINLNLPEFATYPGGLVHEFADQWGFRKTGLMVMNDINEVKGFLDQVAESGAHEGRDVEGFVVRCKMAQDPTKGGYQDWFFKYKFEEPYLMYRQWRECTKSMISGKSPRFKKHVKITEEYLLYARRRLAGDPHLAKLYNHNHGIIALRDDFLKYKNLKGSDAANMEDADPTVMSEVTKDVVLCSVATLGCGKTTIALALTHLFGWGHIQNDNISGKGRPPRFVKAVLEQLEDHDAVFADRNNAQRHERKQLITDVKLQHASAKIVCLNFRHDEAALDDIRRVTRERVLARGDNHQTIHASSDRDKFMGVMEGFIKRFEPCQPFSRPDDGFDNIIDLDPVAGSRANLQKVVEQLHRVFPNLVKEIPPAERFDAAMEFALAYKPSFLHDIPARGREKKNGSQTQQQQQPAKPKQPKLEYMAVKVSKQKIDEVLEKAFQGRDAQTSRFYKQLQQTRRVQGKFHVTLMHRATSRQHPAIWQRYQGLFDAAGGSDQKFGDCEVMLERVVFDDRVMAIVVRLIDEQGQWESVNRITHITIGTRDDSVKPKESNDLLAKWMDEGPSEQNRVQEVVFEKKEVMDGEVAPVLAR